MDPPFTKDHYRENQSRSFFPEAYSPEADQPGTGGSGNYQSLVSQNSFDSGYDYPQGSAVYQPLESLADYDYVNPGGNGDYQSLRSQSADISEYEIPDSGNRADELSRSQHILREKIIAIGSIKLGDNVADAVENLNTVLSNEFHSRDLNTHFLEQITHTRV